MTAPRRGPAFYETVGGVLCGAFKKEPDGPTFVYHLFDTDDLVIYVGMAFDVPSRFAGHRADRPKMWAQAVRYEMCLYPTRTEAKVVELSEIRRLRPRWNKQANEKHWAGNLPRSVAT